MANLAVFGDSITWGAWDPECGGWANRLKLKFMCDASPFDSNASYVETHVFATPGHCVSDVLARVKIELNSMLATHVLIAIGTNDAARFVSLQAFDEDYRQVLAICREAGVRQENIWLLTAPNVCGEMLEPLNRQIEVINTVTKKVAQSERLKVIDVYGLLNEAEFVDDGVHPNAIGHKKLFEFVAESLHV